MKRTGLAPLAIAVLLGWASLILPVHAAPPTVTPSPGYDARLQEKRAASQPAAPAVKRSQPRRAKRPSAH